MRGCAQSCCGAGARRVRASARTPASSTTRRRASASRPTRRASTTLQTDLETRLTTLEQQVQEPGPRPAARDRRHQVRRRADPRPDRGADVRADGSPEAPARSVRRPRLALAQAGGAARAAAAPPPTDAGTPAAPPAPTVANAPADAAPGAPSLRRAVPRVRRPANRRAYDAALDQFKRGDYPGAITGFQSFVKTYPHSLLASSAQYWVGNAQFARKDYRAAIASQRQLLQPWPDSAEGARCAAQHRVGAVGAGRQRRGAAHARGADRQVSAVGIGGQGEAAARNALIGRCRPVGGSPDGVARLARPRVDRSRGNASTAATTCRGRTRAIRTASGCPRSCCSRRRSRRSCRTTRAFVAAFPDVAALARAPLDDVLAHWSGLGYYRRAHHLHAAARAIVADHGGAFPRDAATLATLPGIGRSTAAAIAAFAFGARERDPRRQREARAGAPSRRSTDGPARRRSKPRCGAQPRRLARARHRGVHAGTDGPRRDGVRAHASALRRVPGARRIASRAPRTASRELPSPRPRKALPHRAVRVLLIERGGEVLFEKRPAARHLGRPVEPARMRARTTMCAAIVHARFGAHVDVRDALPPIAHGFTHFALTLHPQRCRRAALAGARGSARHAVAHAARRATAQRCPRRSGN